MTETLNHKGKIFFVFDIDGVIRDVSGSYRRALADTVEHFTHGASRPTAEEIDELKAEGIWNNDWEASQELIQRYFRGLGQESSISYEAIVAFFQSRYRGDRWDGYIANEPLIATVEYFQDLTAAGIGWGFFSGATRASANYVLQRLAIADPVLVAMEDAPGKPDPNGLLQVVKQLEFKHNQSANGSTNLIVYIGDTVADMLTVVKARVYAPNYKYIGIGVIPPHVREDLRDRYTSLLKENGADLVLNNVLQVTLQSLALPNLLKPGLQ